DEEADPVDDDAGEDDPDGPGEPGEGGQRVAASGPRGAAGGVRLAVLLRADARGGHGAQRGSGARSCDNDSAWPESTGGRWWDREGRRCVGDAVIHRGGVGAGALLRVPDVGGPDQFQSPEQAGAVPGPRSVVRPGPSAAGR